VSGAYGKPIIAWADVRFAHRFALGPRPVRLDGRDYTAKRWGDVLRTAIAVIIAAVIPESLIGLVGDPDRTGELQSFFAVLGIVLAVELLWALSYPIWPKKELHRATDGLLG
jgi:hypothetical protein